MAKPHAICATVNGVALRVEYDSIDDVMDAWELAYKKRALPGTSGRATGLSLTIAGHEGLVRIPDAGWLLDKPEDRAA